MRTGGRTATAIAIGMIGIGSRADAQTVDELAREVVGNYERYRAIPDLRVKFALDYEHLNGRRTFAFDRARVETWRKGEKLRNETAATMPVGRGRVATAIATAWDGRVASSLRPEPGDPRAAVEAGGEYTRGSRKNSLIHDYNFYIDFLSYPDGSGGAPSPAKGGPVSWLPAVIVDALGDYRLRGAPESEGGAPCLVLERAGREVFWFDPAKGYALRRRDTFDPATGHRKASTTLDDFAEVAGVWLPRRIVREEYACPDDPKAVAGQPRSRQTIEVVEFSTDPIPDGTFRIAPPDGVTVHGDGRQVFHTRYRSGVGPIAVAAELAREPFAPPNRGRLWAAACSAVALVLVVFLVAASARNRRSRPAREGL